jgi:hypothetical protein
MNKLCQVQNCRFPYDHTTKGHKCGICHKFGHGQIEHYNQELKNNLKQFHNEILPQELQCTIPNCHFSKYHTTNTHQCRTCSRFGHGIDQCIIQYNDINDDLLNNIHKQDIYDFMLNVLNNPLDKTIYIRINTYNNDYLFIKMNVNNHISTCFIANYLEQYNKNTEDYQLLQRFLNGSTDYTEQFFKKPYVAKNCPICRIHNLVKDIDIFIDSECKVCMQNNVELVFIECKHACLCKECYEKI